MSTVDRESPTSPLQSARIRRKAIIAGAVGNVVEWYDFVVYAYMATTLAKLFFPSQNEQTSLLASLAVFGVGFAARPLGAVLFAHYGDRAGRQRALSLSVMLMGGSTLMMALLPTYESIGFFAPALLVVARLVQGASAGGEFAGSGAFLVEYAPKNRRALYGSIQQITIAVGLILGSGLVTAMNILLSPEAFSSWGWRVVFLIGSVLALSGLYIRKSVPETPEFTKVQQLGDIERRPLAAVWQQYRRQLLFIIPMTAGPAVVYYLYQTYLVNFAVSVLGMEPRTALLANTLGLVAFAVSLPIVALVSDRVGRRPLLITHGVAVIVLTYPLFAWMDHSRSFTSVVVTAILGNVMAGLYGGAVIAAYVEMFPARVRYSGFSVPYGIALAVFGGSAPFVAALLTGIFPIAIGASLQLLILMPISLFCFFRMRETYNSELE
jgi:MHS family proline/betaine transporter-like MFS transporter